LGFELRHFFERVGAACFDNGLANYERDFSLDGIARAQRGVNFGG